MIVFKRVVSPREVGKTSANFAAVDGPKQFKRSKTAKSSKSLYVFVKIPFLTCHVGLWPMPRTWNVFAEPLEAFTLIYIKSYQQNA